jgi:hypothetical protein
MAKLVVFKSVRSNTNVDFFVQTEAEKAALTMLGLYTIVGERVTPDLLVKTRTVFFPSLADFEAWSASSVQLGVEARKNEQYQASNIAETREVFDINFNL